MQRLGDGIVFLRSLGRAEGNNVAPLSLLLSWFYRGDCSYSPRQSITYFSVQCPQLTVFPLSWLGLSSTLSLRFVWINRYMIPYRIMLCNCRWSLVVWGSCGAEETLVLWPKRSKFGQYASLSNSPRYFSWQIHGALCRDSVPARQLQVDRAQGCLRFTLVTYFWTMPHCKESSTSLSGGGASSLTCQENEPVLDNL